MRKLSPNGAYEKQERDMRPIKKGRAFESTPFFWICFVYR
jgi:hypothetical protein